MGFSKKTISTLIQQDEDEDRPPPNLACFDLFEGSREDYIRIGVPLYEAAIIANWNAAKLIFDIRPDLIRFAITENYETPLHIAAASAASTKSVLLFVRNLVDLMDVEDLELQNKSYNTPLSLAAAAGNVKTAIVMLQKNRNLLDIPGSNNMLPLYVAALFAKHDMVNYLYDHSNKMSGHFWTPRTRASVLLKCVEADIFDVALKIVKDCPELAQQTTLLTDVLLLLAHKTQAFDERKSHLIVRVIESIFAFLLLKNARNTEKVTHALQLLRTIWQNISIRPQKEIDDIIQGPPLMEGDTIIKYPSRILFLSAKLGNTRFITELARSYPDLVWKKDDKGQTIFHVAVKHRHAKIYNLLYEIGSMKDQITNVTDKKGNNMLHLAAKTAKHKQLPSVSGVALQMQRELLWYKEVEQMLPPSYRQRKNVDGETPYDLFTKKQRELVGEGGEWMKNTASQCMVVSALIATTIFAAGFTVPGGYNQESDFRQRAAFMIFVISNAASLVLALTSLLMFLSLLTSRHSECNISESLPTRLMLGLITLLLSTVTMMIAFTASFLLLYNKNLKSLTVSVILLAIIPAILFSIPQVRFIRELFYSMLQSSYLFKPKKHMLY